MPHSSQSPEPGGVRGSATILFLLDTLDIGGTETHTVQLAKRLNEKGHRIVIGCLHSGGILAADLKQAGIPVVEFPKTGSLLSLRGIYQIMRLARYIRRYQFSVIHTHDLWANLMGVVAARIAGTRVIISSQRDLGHLWWYTPLRIRIIRIIHLLAGHVLANSSAVRDALVRDFRLPATRIRIIRNGIDVERFAKAHADRAKMFPTLENQARLVILIANMHSSVKGHLDLIDAAFQVCRAIPETRFLLVGDGKERPMIEERVKDADLSQHFLFLGRRTDIPELLACAEVSVLPSRAEGLPNVILEAMAAGLPVVATRVGGIPEIIVDEESGLLVPPNKPSALAKAIIRVLRDPAFAAQIGRTAREQIRTHFGFDRVVIAHEELYGISQYPAKSPIRLPVDSRKAFALGHASALPAGNGQTEDSSRAEK
jgi:glycosyltransferase involved in cell wall biosynthesis